MRITAHPMRAVAAAAALGLTLTGCGSDNGGSGSGEAAADCDTTLTVSGWSKAVAPEFQRLADVYNESHPDSEVVIREYDAANYDTQLTADLAAGTAPDVYSIKAIFTFPNFQQGGQLVDVSHLADELPEAVGGVDAYSVDDATYAIPFRQDAWYLFYNKDLFDQAGVEYPDGQWTWDDYVTAAQQLSEALPDADGAYHHIWHDVVQGFATTQSPDASYLEGDFSYMEPFYDRALELQESGAATDYGTVSTNALTYQGQFGTQKTAMMLMGSWYVGVLLEQQASGQAGDFGWSFAPAPQIDSSTLDAPVTLGGPTGMGINPAIDECKMELAENFLAFTASEEAASALAEIGITPSNKSEAVAETYFSVEGVPQDDLARSAFTDQVIKAPVPVPVAPETPQLSTILQEAHSAIMSGTTTVEAGLAEASARAASVVSGS